MKSFQNISEKNAVVIALGCIAVSIVAMLFVARVLEQTPAENAWEVGFLEPECARCLDFFIANTQSGGMFAYEIVYGNDTIATGEVPVAFGEKRSVAITEEEVFIKGEGVYRVNVRDVSGNTREVYRKIH